MRSRDVVTLGRCDGVTLSDVIGRRCFGEVFQARVGVGNFALAKAMDQLAPHSELEHLIGQSHGFYVRSV